MPRLRRTPRSWSRHQYVKQLAQAGSENLIKSDQDFRKARREVEYTVTRLQNSTDGELVAETRRAVAQCKELRKRGFAREGPHELCSVLQAAIVDANRHACTR